MSKYRTLLNYAKVSYVVGI